tara:strand:+ start:106 stop:969 length:864 start_codon:yes stop_codon:yes gene_type:complete
MYSEFDLDLPDSLDDAMAMMANGKGEDPTPLAGGTNLIVDIRAKRENPSHVVSLNNVTELRRVEIDDKQVVVGGRTTVSDLLRHEEFELAAPSLAQSARVFGGQIVRNAATIAGNIGSGSPAADLVPPLLSLDAKLTLASHTGTREVPLDEFYLDYKKNVRRPDELITRIFWPRPVNAVNTFYKLARRKGDAITITGVAITLAVENRACSRARIALGAVAPVVLRARKAEAMLEGEALTPALIEAAAKQAVNECEPIDDVRASAEYRRHTVHALTRRLVTQAWDRLT